MSLDEKMINITGYYEDSKVIREEDVKQFIKEARELLEGCISGGCDSEHILETFDKLAGEGLV